MEKVQKYTIKQEDLSIEDWEYVGEGNQHLLIKCTDEKASLYGFLMRFNKQLSQKMQEKKVENEEVSCQAIKEKKASDSIIKDLQLRLQNYCLKYLFSKINKLSDFLQEAIVVDYSEMAQQFQEFVTQIEKKIQSQRSESKRDKKIDLAQTTEIIENFQQNYGSSDSRFSSMVEIKPKSPLEEYYTDAQMKSALQNYTEEQQTLIMTRFNQADEHSKCRFFKMQLNKLQNDPECTLLSKYHPINLYKGNIEEEMKNLLLTPLNNLNITQYSGEQNQASIILGQVEELKTALKSVLRMIHLYNDQNSQLKDVFSSFISQAQFYLEQPESFYEGVYNQILCEINNGVDLKQASLKDLEEANSKKNFYECKLVIKFLLSVAFRDLSVLINIFTTTDSKEVLSHQNHHQQKFKQYKSKDDENEILHSRIAIIDNDLKPLSTYEKYMKLEKLNLELYLQYLLHQNN